MCFESFRRLRLRWIASGFENGHAVQLARRCHPLVTIFRFRSWRLGISCVPPTVNSKKTVGRLYRACAFYVCGQVMSLRKQVRVMEVELVQARLSGLAGGFGFGGGGAPGMGMSMSGRGASAKAYREALEESAELHRCVRELFLYLLRLSRTVAAVIGASESCFVDGRRLETDVSRLSC